MTIEDLGNDQRRMNPGVGANGSGSNVLTTDCLTPLAGASSRSRDAGCAADRVRRGKARPYKAVRSATLAANVTVIYEQRHLAGRQWHAGALQPLDIHGL
jgi:hypothetical protein